MVTEAKRDMSGSDVEDAEEEVNLDGAFELGRFSMEDESDTLWFQGMNGKPEEFHIPHLRDLLKAASRHDLNGLELEEFLMGFVLQEAAREESGKVYTALAGKGQEILEADTALRLRIESKMRPDKIRIDDIKRAAGFDES